MTEGAFDFAVIGSTPLALLVAGLLAGQHGRRVCLAADFHSSQRLPHGMDLSVAPLTRPESWLLLKTAVPEALRLIGRIAGKAAFERLDPVFVAETPWGHDALGHVRHMAGGFGQAVEPLPENPALPEGATGIRFRDAALLHRPAFEAALAPWLEQAGVRLVPQMEAKAEFTILADDNAVLEHGSALLHPAAATSLLTEPVAPLPASVMVWLDRSMLLRQGAERGVSAIVQANAEAAVGQLGAVLPRPARLAGRAPFVAATTPDGGPLLGFSAPGVFTIAGLGATGAFLAPAIARFLAGEAGNEEADWIDARSPLADRSRIAEVAP